MKNLKITAIGLILLIILVAEQAACSKPCVNMIVSREQAIKYTRSYWTEIAENKLDGTNNKKQLLKWQTTLISIIQFLINEV